MDKYSLLQLMPPDGWQSPQSARIPPLGPDQAKLWQRLLMQAIERVVPLNPSVHHMAGA